MVCAPAIRVLQFCPPVIPSNPPEASKSIAVPSLYLVTFKFSFVHHCFPIKTVLYGLLSMSETVEVPQVKEAAVTVIVPVAFTELQLVPVSGIV